MDDSKPLTMDEAWLRLAGHLWDAARALAASIPGEVARDLEHHFDRRQVETFGRADEAREDARR